MDYFRKILTGPQQGQTPSGAETVYCFADKCCVLCISFAVAVATVK